MKVAEYRKVKKESEYSIQCAYATWLRMKRLQDWRYNLVRISANGGKRDKIAGAKLKASGVSKGDWDVMIHLPHRGYHSSAMEFKTSKGNLTDEQTELGRYFILAGIDVFVVTSVDQAISITETIVEETPIKK